MFKIHGGATAFNQWELNKQITDPSMAVGDKVIFNDASGATILMTAYTKDGVVVANVPNKMLQTTNPVVMKLYGKPETRTSIAVRAANYPVDYQYVDNTEHPRTGENADLLERLDELSEEIEGIKASGGGFVDYYPQGPYLYHDTNYSTKVTRADVLRDMANKMIRIADSYGEYFEFPVRIETYEEYATVYLIYPGSGNQALLSEHYTAEWTASSGPQ